MGWGLALAVGVCTPARAAGPSATLDVGYLFRSQDDGRQHGVAALASLQSPELGPVALRLDGLAAFIPASTDDGFGNVHRDLSLAGGALSLAYLFDDTDVDATASLGPLVAASADGERTTPLVGALASIGLRFPIVEGLDLEARVLLPVPLYADGSFVLPGARSLEDGTAVTWPLQFSMLLGLSFEPLTWLAPAAVQDPVSSASPP